MATKVISIRLAPKELISIYDFLSIACDYNVKNLPVSSAISMSLAHMIRWVGQSVDLPEYSTDKEALVAIEKYINKVPTAYMEKSPMPVIQESKKEIPLINQELNNNSEQKEQVGINEEKKERIIDMIDKFREKEIEADNEELLDAIKTDSIYKKEE